MEHRISSGREVKELKLGATFKTGNYISNFHTLKYDFKPASVDLSKFASLDVGPNNQVTVTVPNLESSGVPHTIFKGNQRKYGKECVLIFDKKTGGMTLEKLNHNIQVKKTRTELTAKTLVVQQKVENNTQRTSTKTRVSTGIRKTTISFLPRQSPMQSSPSYPLHRSPQSAPAWNANNGQSTLPSIPLIGVDEDSDIRIPSFNSTLLNSSSIILPSNASGSQSPQLKQFCHMYNLPNTPCNKLRKTIDNDGLSNCANTNSLEDESGELSSSDSSSDSDSSRSGSDTDESIENTSEKVMYHATEKNRQPLTTQDKLSYENNFFPSILRDDLQLSESNSSDSDS